MENPQHIIKNVVITEKTTDMTEHNQYTFVVAKNANKIAIKNAVQDIFDRKVKSVNIINKEGKTRRTRFGTGRKPGVKKAIVTLKDGESAIDLF